MFAMNIFNKIIGFIENNENLTDGVTERCILIPSLNVPGTEDYER